MSVKIVQKIKFARYQLSIAQICLLLIIFLGVVSILEWRFNLLDQVQAKTASFLSQSDFLVSLNVVTPVPTEQPAISNPPLPAVPDIHDTILNTLAAQSRLPNTSDLLVDEAEDRVYLQSVLDTIFPDGTVGLSEEEISIEILRYVTSVLELKTNTGNYATKFLQEGYAICGGMSISFQTLVRMMGIPAHMVNMYGLISQGGHTMVEVYYDGQWHLYDPTFGVVLYSETEYNRGMGRIGSLNELVANSAEEWYIFKVVDQPWQGYDPSSRTFGVVRAEEDYLTDSMGYPFLAQYRQMFAIAFPVAYDLNQIISFPVIADLTHDGSFSVGSVDNSYNDTIAATTFTETARKAGMYLLLGGASRQYVHTWFIKVPSPGLVRVTYYSAESAPSALMLWPLKGIYVVSSSQADKKSEFLLRVSDRDAAAQFWSYNGIFWVDAIQAEWLEESTDINQQPNS